MALPYLVNQIPGQSIIVATLTSAFSASDTAALYAEITEVAAGIEGAYYRILDVSGLSTNLAGTIQTLVKTAEGTTGSASDPRVRKNFYVELGEEGKMLRAFLQQNPPVGFDMIITNTLEQALNTIYTEMEDAGDSAES